MIREMIPDKLPVTVIVLTYNEEQNLANCLRSVADWASEIFVVDSGSTDRTLGIARQYTDQIIVHEFVNQAQQFNWALDKLPIRSEWVLRLDADEYLLPELKAEIIAILPTLPSHVTGLYMKRRVYFKGRWIRHGAYYPTWLLRLFRQGKARSEQLEMDEHIIVLEGETRHLQHDFVDHNHKDLAFWTGKHEQFATREARALTRKAQADELSAMQGKLGGQPARKRWLKGNIYARSPLFLRAFAYFLYRYIFRLGFLDGTEGLVFHFLQGCWYRFYVDARIWEARQGQSKALVDSLEGQIRR